MTPSTVRLSLTDEQRKKPKAWHQTYFFEMGKKSVFEATKKELEETRLKYANAYWKVKELEKENEALKRILDDVRKLLMIK